MGYRIVPKENLLPIGTEPKSNDVVKVAYFIEVVVQGLPNGI